MVSALVEYFGFPMALLSTSIVLLLFTGLFCLVTLRRKGTEYKPVIVEADRETNLDEIKR